MANDYPEAYNGYNAGPLYKSESIQLPIHRYTKYFSFNRDRISVHQVRDITENEIRMFIETCMVGEDVDTVYFQSKICKTWWDRVKRDLFPTWFLKRFPVEYVVEKAQYDVRRVYPFLECSLKDQESYITITKTL